MFCMGNSNQRQTMANNFCSNCGEPIPESGANVCTNCGKPLREPQTESTSTDSYQSTTGGNFQQSGSSNAQSDSSNAQSGSSNAQAGSSNAQQAESGDAQQAYTNDQNTNYEQQTRNENYNSYARPGNTAYVNDKNPIVSVILSFFFPGAGQVYNGDLKKGLMIVIGAIITLFIFFPASFVVWVYGLYDAYTDADKMNKGQIPYAEATMQDALIYAGVFIGSFILLFVIFFFIGLFFGLMMI